MSYPLSLDFSEHLSQKFTGRASSNTSFQAFGNIFAVRLKAIKGYNIHNSTCISKFNYIINRHVHQMAKLVPTHI